MKVIKFFFITIIPLLLIQCSSANLDDFEPGRKDPVINFVLTAYDTDIDDPSKDRRSYYRIYINKIDSGRTTTGLESQAKYFEAELSPNRHLIKLEKWVLDEEQGRYFKVNNIEQPKPDFIYITVGETGTVKVTMKSTKYGNAAYSKVVE